MTNTTFAGTNQGEGSVAESGDERDFWLMNKNIGNYPLARDPRVSVSWRRRKSGWWRAQLPGEPRISLRLPPHAPDHVRRAPTAFDMKVLATMQILARKFESVHYPDRGIVTIRELSWLAENVGLVPSSRTQSKLEDSLEYWTYIRVVHKRWYCSEQKKHEAVKLPPPLKRVSGGRWELEKNFVGFRLSKIWWDMGVNFVAVVPLPLPDTAAAQNLVLMLMTGIRHRYQSDSQSAPTLSARSLAAKLGMGQRNPWRRLRGVCEQAAQWFKEHDGVLGFGFGEGQVTFIVTDPKLPKTLRHVPRKWTESRAEYKAARDKANQQRKQRRIEQQAAAERRKMEAERRNAEAIIKHTVNQRGWDKKDEQSLLDRYNSGRCF